MDQQYGLELLRENQKLRDEIERLNDWKRIIENAPGQAKDTAIERFNFTQSIMPIIEIWKEKVKTLESELQQMKAAVPDYDILEQTSQEGLINIVVGLMNELEQYKEALKTIKTYSSGPIITIGESDEEDGFPEGSVYGYNMAIEQITNEVINPLLGEPKPKEDDDD